MPGQIHVLQKKNTEHVEQLCCSVCLGMPASGPIPSIFILTSRTVHLRVPVPSAVNFHDSRVLQDNAMDFACCNDEDNTASFPHRAIARKRPLENASYRL
jgi:hypothetical protein